MIFLCVCVQKLSTNPGKTPAAPEQAMSWNALMTWWRDPWAGRTPLGKELHLKVLILCQCVHTQDVPRFMCCRSVSEEWSYVFVLQGWLAEPYPEMGYMVTRRKDHWSLDPSCKVANCKAYHIPMNHSPLHLMCHFRHTMKLCLVTLGETAQQKTR